jgi:hypothetical protein
MITFPTSIPIQDTGCDILLVCALHEGNRRGLIQQRACETLHAALNVQCREVSIIEKSFSILRILSTDVESREPMLNISISKAVVATMRRNLSHASIQQDGCALLSNISVDVSRNEVSKVGKDEISVIVDAMQGHPSSESVMASACFALKNFSYNTSNLRSMNATSNMIEVLEQAAASFDSMTISASQTSEKLYLSQAEDESSEDHAYEVLMKSISTQSDDPETMVVIKESLREYAWSCRHVTACLKKLKSLALTSSPHRQRFLESMTQDELLALTTEFSAIDTVKVELTILVGLYGEVSDW